MKKENKIRIICIVLLMLGAVFYIYNNSKFAFFLILPPLMLYTALIPPKKIHMSAYSKYLSFVGILLVILSYIVYFAYSFEIWRNEHVEIMCMLVICAYYVFLVWYKKAWT